MVAHSVSNINLTRYIEGTNYPPEARFTAIPSSGPPPLNVQFTSTSFDFNDDTLSHMCNFAGLGTSTDTGPPSFTFRETVTFSVQKWRRVKMSAYDMALLRNIRKLYKWVGYIREAPSRKIGILKERPKEKYFLISGGNRGLVSRRPDAQKPQIESRRYLRYLVKTSGREKARLNELDQVLHLGRLLP
jgi:hypothetical protein